MINQNLLTLLEMNARMIENPVKRGIALEMVWSVRRQRAYQHAVVEAGKFLKANPNTTADDLLFWINERTELAHRNEENLNVS